MVSIFIYKEPEKDNLQVEVSIDGKLIETYPLGSDSKYNIRKIIDVGNTLVIENGEVYILEADCADELCVKQGKIKRANESIICLPHKLVIKITSSEAGDNNSDLDVIQ